MRTGVRWWFSGFRVGDNLSGLPASRRNLFTDLFRSYWVPDRLRKISYGELHTGGYSWQKNREDRRGEATESHTERNVPSQLSNGKTKDRQDLSTLIGIGTWSPLEASQSRYPCADRRIRTHQFWRDRHGPQNDYILLVLTSVQSRRVSWFLILKFKLGLLQVSSRK